MQGRRRTQLVPYDIHALLELLDILVVLGKILVFKQQNDTYG